MKCFHSFQLDETKFMRVVGGEKAAAKAGYSYFRITKIFRL